MLLDGHVAEREGFEPTIPLRVCRISSAVLSTTQPPLRSAPPSFRPMTTQQNSPFALILFFTVGAVLQY